MDGKVQLSRLVKPLNLQDIQNSVQEHKAILDALALRNVADAESRMENHINNNL
jgi:DNA-binding GntR family transcriptional regulator